MPISVCFLHNHTMTVNIYTLAELLASRVNRHILIYQEVEPSYLCVCVYPYIPTLIMFVVVVC